jgi:pimeloyl-ACP methyl ester carboxylesterase
MPRTDPPSSKENLLRAPNGILQDLRDYWANGKAQYDPTDIRVPTLLIHAEWDADLPSDQTRAYFAKLVNAPYRRYIEIGEGTHAVIMKKNRMQLFHEVAGFLNDSDPQALN